MMQVVALDDEAAAADALVGEALDDDADGDAYADLEQWYAASLPHVHSSASFAHMSDAFSSRPATAVADENGDELMDDYAIDLLDEQNPADQSSHAADQVIPRVFEEPRDNLTVDVPPIDDTLDDASFLAFVPKKLRSALPGDPVAVARCCDQCHSDLNGKLLVKCATCSFRRHLYCFAPPLREHPALVALAHVPRHKQRSMVALVAQWQCLDCVTRLGKAPSPEAKLKTMASPSVAKKIKKRMVAPLASVPTSTPPPKAVAFDWHAFRADKFAKVIEARDEEDSELVLYAPSDALLRKSARLWQQHVHRRQQQRAQHIARLAKCTLPPTRPLRVLLSPREAAEVAASNQRHHDDEVWHERELMDDALHYKRGDPRPVFATLRWRPPPPVVDESDGESDNERRAEEGAREAQEREAMEGEDDDAPTPSQALRVARRRAFAVAAASDPRLLGLALAARIIERVMVHWLGTTRHQIQEAAASRRQESERQCMFAEEQRQQQRRDQIHSLIRGLRLRVQIVVAIGRAKRRVQRVKALAKRLAEAQAEEALLREKDSAAARLALAKRRIQRFFCGRVRRYLYVKKRVMARRIQRWWERRHYVFVFRALAIHARRTHRTAAARLIQQTFRAFRVYQQFQTLRDQLRLRRVRRVLRAWLVRRFVAKERDRVFLWTAAIQISGRADLVAPDAPVQTILASLGLALYERSDFGPAALLLERALRLRSDSSSLDRATRLALAYSHHQSWYATCHPQQLALAEQHYRLLVTETVDTFVLQELAFVLLHRDAFRDALRILAHLIACFRDDDGFPLWLVLAGVALAQVGEFDDSAAYLSYVVDMALPPPYVERDVLALCAMSYEHTRGRGRATATEAWRAAVRLWSLDGAGGRHDRPSSGTSSHRLKWDLVVDLATRASDAGHFFIACRSLLYAFERLAPHVDDALEVQRAWWRLGDAFRRLGRLDLFVDATARSRDDASDDERRTWRADAETAAQQWLCHLTTASPVALVTHIQLQHLQNDWQLQDV